MDKITDRELYEYTEQINTSVIEVKKNIDYMLELISELKENTDNSDAKVSSLKLTLEKEVRNNIDIIAKRQSNIIKMLCDRTTAEHSKEMLSIRLNILETDVRNIKEKIGIA